MNFPLQKLVTTIGIVLSRRSKFTSRPDVKIKVHMSVVPYSICKSITTPSSYHSLSQTHCLPAQSSLAEAKTSIKGDDYAHKKSRGGEL